MPDKLNFRVIFKEIDRLREEAGPHLDQEQLDEYEKIRVLAEAARDLQEQPEQTYFTTSYHSGAARSC